MCDSHVPLVFSSNFKNALKIFPYLHSAHWILMHSPAKHVVFFFPPTKPWCVCCFHLWKCHQSRDASGCSVAIKKFKQKPTLKQFPQTDNQKGPTWWKPHSESCDIWVWLFRSKLWTAGAGVSHSAAAIKADRDTQSHNNFYLTWMLFLLLEEITNKYHGG